MHTLDKSVLDLRKRSDGYNASYRLLLGQSIGFRSGTIDRANVRLCYRWTITCFATSVFHRPMCGTRQGNRSGASRSVDDAINARPMGGQMDVPIYQVDAFAGRLFRRQSGRRLSAG